MHTIYYLGETHRRPRLGGPQRIEYLRRTLLWRARERDRIGIQMKAPGPVVGSRLFANDTADVALRRWCALENCSGVFDQLGLAQPNDKRLGV